VTAFLECRHVSKVFGGGLFNRNQNTALEDFSLEIKSEPPSITAIVGESGSGKTTLARLLLGLITPTRGEVLYQGSDLRSLSGSERRQFLRDVQVIFQDPYEVYNPFYRVDHVLETPIRKFGLAHGRDAERDLAEEALRAVGLRPDETLGRHPHQLSGGQRQRVMVARALLLMAHGAGVFVRRYRTRRRQQQIEQPILGVGGRLRSHFLEPLLAHHVDAELDEIAHHRLDVAPDVADFRELARFDLDERRLREPREPARDLRLADAGRSDHQDVLRGDFLGEIGRELLPPHSVAQRDRDGPLCRGLADDVLVELGDNLPRRQGFGGGLGGFGKEDGHGRLQLYSSSMTICEFV